MSFSTVENQASGLMTVLVQVEESALSSARSVFLGLAPEDRSGRSSALIRWLPAQGTTCGDSTPGIEGADSGQIVLIICMVVLLVAGVIAAAVMIKFYCGSSKVWPQDTGDVEKAEDHHISTQQWQLQS